MTKGFSIEFLVYINIALDYHHKRAYYGNLLLVNYIKVYIDKRDY